MTFSEAESAAPTVRRTLEAAGVFVVTVAVVRSGDGFGLRADVCAELTLGAASVVLRLVSGAPAHAQEDVP